MKIGLPREIRIGEYRVGLTPSGVEELTKEGHSVLVEKDAGVGAGFSNEEYKEAGATIVKGPLEIAKNTEMVVKVKQAAPEEYKLLDNLQNKILFSFFQLAGSPTSLLERLLENKITSIDYITVRNEKGKLPVLKAMREMCGVAAVQYATQFLQKKYKAMGITLSSIENTKDAQVVIIGGGVTGSRAAKITAALGAKVTLLEINEERIKELKRELEQYLGHSLFHNITFQKSNDENVAEAVKQADLLIGAATIHGERAPIVVKKEMVEEMKRDSLIVDVPIDQGGCVWGSKITTSLDPLYNHKGILYCGIENWPGEFSFQATQSLTHATLPFVKRLANEGIEALREDKNFAHGLHTYKGKITYKPVAEDLNMMDNYLRFEDIE